MIMMIFQNVMLQILIKIPKNIASVHGCCESFGVVVCESGVGLDGARDISAGVGVGLDIGDPFTPCNTSKIIINLIFFYTFFYYFYSKYYHIKYLLLD